MPKSANRRPNAVCVVEGLEGRTVLASGVAVYAPHADVKGTSMSVWTREWLRWAISPSADQFPLTDSTGEKTNARQPSRVFFLAGGLAGSGPVTRHAYVKPNRPIFFPVLNAFWVNFDTPDGDPPFAANEKNIRNSFHEDVASYKDMFVTVDGKKVADLASHVEHDPLKGVTIKFASDNFFADPKKLGKSATEGIYVMLKPLTPGKHVVHFGGTDVFQNFSLDVTYTLDVVGPKPASTPTAFVAAAKTPKKIDPLASSILD